MHCNVSLPGVYSIQHIESGVEYIGSSNNIKIRIAKHYLTLRKNTHHSKYLQRLWNKHGDQSFCVKVLLHCNDKHLKFYEQLCLDKLNPKLNGTKNANSPVVRGQKLPKEWVEKVKISVQQRYAKGFKVLHPPRSQEYRESVSLVSKKKWLDQQSREKMTQAIRSAMTEDERAKRSKRAAALWENPEYRAKAIAARKGKASNKGYRCTPEQIENRRRNARISNTKRKYGDKWQEFYLQLYPNHLGDINAQ